MKKSHRQIAAVVGFLLAVALPVSAQQVSVSMNDGRVTLIADNAPLWMVMNEWARVGKTTIVNGEKLVGSPVTLQLVDVPESKALDTVLRTAAGYVVAPRAVDLPGASRYDRILIMAATSSPPASGSGLGRGAGGLGNLPQARPVGGADPVSDEDMPPDVRGRLGPGGMMMRPNQVGGRPPDAAPDYANPAQLRQLPDQSGTGAPPANPYGIPQNPYQPAVPGGSVGGVAPGGSTGSQAAPRPGMAVPNPQGGPGSQLGPYGMPANVKPGSVVAPPQEPDKSKYVNPPKPPGGPGGSGL